jgi:N,N'-diacetylbacillosaminyl-diphospho-undecaprenol alpha-1,3-N-acetylgalactosaminyltransferase
MIRGIITLLYRVSLRFSNVVIFQNEDDMNMFIKVRVIPESKAVLIKGSGIDTQIWTPIRIRSDKSKIRILMVSRIIKHKGVIEYIEAAKILKEKFNDKLEFILVGPVDKGNPSDLGEITDKLRSSKYITYMGERSDILDIMRQSDIFVLPSYREGLPKSGIEAAAVGLPIIATDVPGCKCLVDNGINGFLIKPRDVKDLCSKIEKLIINEDLRTSMGRNSRIKAIREFDISKVVSSHIDLYNRLLQGLN